MDTDIGSIIKSLRENVNKNIRLDFIWSMYQRGYKQALIDVEKSIAIIQEKEKI